MISFGFFSFALCIWPKVLKSQQEDKMAEYI